MNSKSIDNLFFSRSRDFLDSYLTNQISRSYCTVEAYRDALSIFRRYVLSRGYSIMTFKFEDCTRDFLLDYLEYLKNEGYETSTINQRLAAIKSYVWYVADGNISHQQTAFSVSRVPFLRQEEKVLEILNEECLTALLQAPSNSLIGIRDTTIMVLLYDSAMRLSELLNLKVKDINFTKDTPYVRIHGKGDKERIVSLSDKTVDHLKNYIKLYHERKKPNTDYLFYTTIHGRSDKMSPGNIERLINKYADSIRAEHSDLPKNVHPHMFRRTRATNLYQNDVEIDLVGRILGHSSTQTTRVYAKPSLEMIKKAMEKSTNVIEKEEPQWPSNEEEIARMFGLR